MSDNSEGRSLCINHPDKCLIGPINSHKFIQCVQCRTGGIYPEDETCLNKTETVLCPYSWVEKLNRCVTISYGEALIRGCFIDHQWECAAQGVTPATCTVCAEKGCNSQQYFGLSCKKCSSDKTPSCATSDEERDLVQCISEDLDELACYRGDTGKFRL